MAQIAPIAILDGAATPVTHTYNPVTSSGAAMYRENIASLALAGQGTISVSAKMGDLNKLRIVLSMPVLESIPNLQANGQGYTAPPKVAYVVKANLDLLLPNRSTAQQRKDLRIQLSNLMLNAQVADSVDLLAPPY